uniref:Uncharacterized protein n=1 Tax=Mycena chlorophos TaxID=658473 RepID=A0ABQ0L0M4_MYCCL|nr:predicted protein [Mycena chlorophos]
MVPIRLFPLTQVTSKLRARHTAYKDSGARRALLAGTLGPGLQEWIMSFFRCLRSALTAFLYACQRRRILHGTQRHAQQHDLRRRLCPRCS